MQSFQVLKKPLHIPEIIEEQRCQDQLWRHLPVTYFKCMQVLNCIMPVLYVDVTITESQGWGRPRPPSSCLLQPNSLIICSVAGECTERRAWVDPCLNSCMKNYGETPWNKKPAHVLVWLPGVSNHSFHWRGVRLGSDGQALGATNGILRIALREWFKSVWHYI